MSGRSDLDTRHHLSLNSPHQISKEMQGSDGSIPLSPQWLLPKPGENKPGMVTGEPHASSQPDVVKASGNSGDFHDSEKKRDIFRPSMPDSESGRRDRWREEERDTSSTIRRDRWRELDRELGDIRKTERWYDGSAVRYAGEARRAPSERWTESGNRENSFDQRRESKWNTRWGPDDKESERESWRDKSLDSSRDSEGFRDKGAPPAINRGKDMDKEADHYSRAWRSTTSLSRGRAEPPHHQSLTPSKQVSMFGHGRGRMENTSSTFSAGRGRVNTSGITSNNNSSHPLGTLPDESDSTQGDSSTIRYSRTKLLDIYRMVDMRTCVKPLVGFVEVPSLTQLEPVEPLALSAPTPEEAVILKGIDKGDIVSSGAPQVSKDGSVGRGSIDAAQLRRTKFGSREDFPSGVDDYKDEISGSFKSERFNYSESGSYEKYAHPYGPEVVSTQNIQLDNRFNVEDPRAENTPLKKVNAEATNNNEVNIQENSSAHPGTLWRSELLLERSHGSLHDWQDKSADVRSRAADIGWPHSQKDRAVEWDGRASASTYYKDEPNWQSGQTFQFELSRDSIIKHQASEVLDGEREASVRLVHEDSFISRDRVDDNKLLPHPSPEDLSLCYKDPQGEIQGPFSGSDMIGWFEAGYFGIDLQVRLASASPDSPFSSLGDVMPHLRMKARPPPGFGAPKQSESIEASSRVKFSSLGKVHSGLAEADLMRIEQRNRHDSSTEAENRFLESLMSGNISSSPLEAFPLTEGMSRYAGNNAGCMPSVGSESGGDLNYLLAQRMSLARQRSLPNPLPYWPGRDATPLVSQTDIASDSSVPQSKLLPPAVDSPHRISLSPQHVDLRSVLQVAGKSSSAVNNGVLSWSNLSDIRSLSSSVQGGMSVLDDKMDTNHNHHFIPSSAFGSKHQRLQPQHPPSMSHMITQPMDHTSSTVNPEKLLSSGISQDSQMLSILQQQYLLSQLQLHPQAPVTAQLSLLDKLLLLKQQQQQKQEQQQLLLQQRQHLLSQVFSEHQTHQHFIEPSYPSLQAAIVSGNTSVDHLALRQPHEAFQINSNMPQAVPLTCDNLVQESVLGLQPDQRSNIVNLSSQISQDVSYSVTSGMSALHLPHQVFQSGAQQENLVSTVPQQIEDIQQKVNALIPEAKDNSPLSEVAKSSNEMPPGKPVLVPDICEGKVQECVPQNNSRLDETIAIGSSVAMESHVSSEAALMISDSDYFVGSGKSILFPVKDDSSKVSFGGTVEKSEVQIEHHNAELPVVEEVKNVEVKKSSEKKSRKQKNSKAQSSSDQGKVASKTATLLQSKLEFEPEQASVKVAKPVTTMGAETTQGTSSVETKNGKSGLSVTEPLGSQPAQNSVATGISGSVMGIIEGKVDSKDTESGSLQNTQATTGHRAWKPAPGLKAKSLLEIQQEEQRRAHAEMAVSEIATTISFVSSSSPTPGVGLVANSEPKAVQNDYLDSGNLGLVLGDPQNVTKPKSNKSQLHNLLAEEVLAPKANEKVVDVSTSFNKGSNLPSFPVTNTQMDASVVDDDDFVEAKETKKSRKKAAKAKGAGIKASTPVSAIDPCAAATPIEKSKITRQVQQEKVVLPVPPSGPSLGDFVLWKGDQASTVPAPAWSTDSGKLPKPTSLRDIQKEQEKKATSVPIQTPVVTPKVQSNCAARGSSFSWHLAGTSPSKAAPIHNSSNASNQFKAKAEDDLFWGPLDQSKQESKQSDFPSLASPSGRGSKGTPAKGAVSGSSSRQKSLSSSPASAQPSLKGREDAMTKHSEAMDFRDWCEIESVRLTGTKDTSFLEFCLKQSTSEAKTLLMENLGSFDPGYEFIDKFLNYKELLPTDVIEIAFQSRNDRKITGFGMQGENTDSKGASDLDLDGTVGLDGSTKGGGGKKKGKKGKKVSPAVLGFSVVSNRIMMGEIQSIED